MTVYQILLVVTVSLILISLGGNQVNNTQKQKCLTLNSFSKTEAMFLFTDSMFINTE